MRTDIEQIHELTAELQAKSASLGDVADLESILSVVNTLKSNVDSTVQLLRDALESPEWSERAQKTSGTSPAVSAIYEIASKMATKTEDMYRTYRLLSVELEELGEALRTLIPFYKVGKETLTHQEEVEGVIRVACEDIGKLLQDSVGIGVR